MLPTLGGPSNSKNLNRSGDFISLKANCFSHSLTSGTSRETGCVGHACTNEPRAAVESGALENEGFGLPKWQYGQPHSWQHARQWRRRSRCMTQLSHALPVFQMRECGLEPSDPASLARGVKDSSGTPPSLAEPAGCILRVRSCLAQAQAMTSVIHQREH